MNRPNARPHGQVRHSQVVTTFGPGSLLDLPTQSVIVGGLEHWAGVSEEVHEPRLVEKLKRLLSMPALKLFQPPPDNEDTRPLFAAKSVGSAVKTAAGAPLPPPAVPP